MTRVPCWARERCELLFDPFARGYVWLEPQAGAPA
jgi:hypothetical protein